jgi:hypothetical protein
MRQHDTRRIVVLTGAGISKESGLDTFRDPDGIWATVSVEDAIRRAFTPFTMPGARACSATGSNPTPPTWPWRGSNGNGRAKCCW